MLPSKFKTLKIFRGFAHENKIIYVWHFISHTPFCIFCCDVYHCYKQQWQQHRSLIYTKLNLVFPKYADPTLTLVFVQSYKLVTARTITSNKSFVLMANFITFFETPLNAFFVSTKHVYNFRSCIDISPASSSQ